MDQPEIGGPPSSGVRVAHGRHGDRNRIIVARDGVQGPSLGADEPVRRRLGVVGLSAEPGKANWDSSANGDAFMPLRARAEKEHLLCTGRLPRSDLGAVQVDLSFRLRSGDADLGQSAFARPRRARYRLSQSGDRVLQWQESFPCLIQTQALTSTRLLPSSALQSEWHARC